MDKKSLIIGFFCLLVISNGCDTEKKVEHPQSKQSSTVVTGKIEPSSPSITEQNRATPVDLPKDQPEMGIKKEENATEAEAVIAVEEQQPAPPQEQQQASVSIEKRDAAALPPPTPSSDLEKAEVDSVVDPAEDLAILGEKPEKPGYDPVGKVDPFKALFSDVPTSQASDDTAVMKREKRKPGTPLEMVDLSQLTLVGVVRSDDAARALVEEISGKGYIVREGTYMGVNSGKVVQILQDKIIVEEEIEDALGNISLQKRELKLQKPLGE